MNNNSINLNNIDPDDNFFNELYPNSTQESGSKYYSCELFNDLDPCADYDLSLLNYNVRSFNSNGRIFETWLSYLSTAPKFVILTETWNLFETEQLCSLDGYESFHTYRESHGHSRGGPGGGVSVFFKDNFIGEKIESLSYCSSTIESCVCRVVVNNCNVVIIGIYRPPAGRIDDFLVALEDILTNDIIRQAPVVYVTGDINLDLSNQSNRDVCNYVNLFYSLNYLPTITRPTRFANTDQSDSCSNLDHIWTNSLTNFISGIILYDMTDHLPTFLCQNHISFHTNDEKICIKTRPFSDENLHALNNDLINTDWNAIFNPDIHQFCRNFMSHIDKLYVKNFPLKIKYISQKRLNKPWIDADLKKMINKKSSYFKSYKLGFISREESNIVRNEVNKKVLKARNDYFKSSFTAAKSDMGKTWKLIRKLMGSKTKNANIEKINHNNMTYTEPVKIAEAFNDYFVSVASNLVEQLPSTVHRISTDELNPNSFFLHDITYKECAHIISKMKLTKTNVDSMPLKIFKQISAHVVAPICNLINYSFHLGAFPDPLKIARVTPVFKKGTKNDPGNYRPISSLPFLSKIFERSMANKLTKFLNKFNVISACQFGFRAGMSTTDALLRITDTIFDALNNKQTVLNIQIDLRKAFDAVDHQILLEKLHCYGIRGKQLDWFRNYLSNRHQYVSIKGGESSLKSINTGVPQGSILGPILFLIFINDLPKCSNFFVPTLFADDSTFSAKISNYDESIQFINEELENIRNWTINNKLTINVAKTEVIAFTNKKIDFNDNQIQLDGEFLKFSQTCTFLGVLIDKNVSFSDHISHVNKKLSKNTGIFYRIRDNLTETAKLNYYYSLLYPYMSYGVIVWGSTFKTHLDPLIRQHNRIIKLMSNRNENIDEICTRLQLLKFIDIYNYFTVIYVFIKINEGKYLPIHDLNLRNQGLAVPVHQNLTTTQHSIDFCGPHIFNKLPQHIRNSSNLNSFKRTVKQYYLSQYSYTRD